MLRQLVRGINLYFHFSLKTVNLLSFMHKNTIYTPNDVFLANKRFKFLSKFCVFYLKLFSIQHGLIH